MKKTVLAIMTGVLAFGLLGSSSGSAAASSQTVEVLLDARKMRFPDAKPFQDTQGSVMVPIRFVSESLGAKVSYSKTGKVQTVGITSKEHTVKMTVGQTTALVNGKKKDYGTKIILKQNRTFVPIRLVSEGLGQKVEWDKVSRWVWIGGKDFPSTDDKEYKLTSLSSFRAYTKSSFLFEDVSGNKLKGVKIIKESDLPIQLGDGEVIYSLEQATRPSGDTIAMRYSVVTIPIAFLVKNDDAKYRRALPSAFTDNGDKTGINHYPVVSQSDKFRSDGYDENYTGWQNFKIKQADYIFFDASSTEDYAVVLLNPFK